jgi:hypothetical protein
MDQIASRLVPIMLVEEECEDHTGTNHSYSKFDQLEIPARHHDSHGEA